MKLPVPQLAELPGHADHVVVIRDGVNFLVLRYRWYYEGGLGSSMASRPNVVASVTSFEALFAALRALDL